MRIDEKLYDFLGFLLLLLFLLLPLLLGGCVRSVTVCAQYDHALRRPDPQTGYSRDNIGSSVCTEFVPPGEQE